MSLRLRSRTLTLALGASASLLGLLVASIAAQEPGSAPVRKELEAFQENIAKKAPRDRLKAYEEGIDQVKKSGVLEKALKVGDKAPEFELPSADGKMVKLSGLLSQGPVVVTWYRGGWCPYCNIALRGFHKALPEIRAAGGSLVAISPETPDNSLSTVEKNKIDFAVLSDKGSKVARAFGVSYKVPPAIAPQMKDRLAQYNGPGSEELPLGATYVIDKEGIIRYAFVDGDYRKRAEPSEVVAALNALKK